MTSFYSLQCWNGIFFEDSSLHVLGQQVNLGHEGLPCPHPLAKVHNFTAVDVSSVHSVHLCYCGCQSAPEQCIQLLWHGWFPASMKSPETAFTFDFLNTFHLLNLQSKLHYMTFGLPFITRVTMWVQWNWWYTLIYASSPFTYSWFRIIMINSYQFHGYGSISNSPSRLDMVTIPPGSHQLAKVNVWLSALHALILGRIFQRAGTKHQCL